jgi:hypothetical protein
MSHHLDSPIARQDPRLDITDFYLFRGETGTVFVLNACHSLAGATTPGFHPEGKYEFKVDLDGDAAEELTYRLTFGHRDTAGTQAVQLWRLTGAEAADHSAAGELVLEGRTGDEVTGAGGVRLWAGNAGDPFWIDPDVLHAVGHAFQDGTRVELRDWTPDQAQNLFAGQTVYAIVLEVPDAQLTSTAPGGRIGAWSVASLATDAGGWRPVNRAGLPMIHPLFAQYNEDLGNQLNTGGPRADYQAYGPLVIKEISSVVAAYGTAADPAAYAEAVARRLFPNMLPYAVGTAASFGFAGFNGRSLTDNAPDVMFSLTANTPLTVSIGAESVKPQPRPGFPYVPEGDRDR